MEEKTKEYKTVNVLWKIEFPMRVPVNEDKRMIEFAFNESSWCAGNFLDKLNEYANMHDGCICNICSAEVLDTPNEWIKYEGDETEMPHAFTTIK